MFSSNTETGITATYQDSDGTIDLVVGTLNQDTTGNAATATALETARTIHGVSFDGTANIDLSEVVQDTVGAMFSSNTETGITATYQDSDGTIDLVVGTLNQDTTGNAATATALETARTIGGVSFDGTANITLPGVNFDGNQNTTGNAATATALETARNINGVSFDGTGNITITAAGTTLSDTVPVSKGGTGGTSLTSNGILTGNGTSAIQSESNLTFDGSALSLTGTFNVGVDDTGHDVKFFGATSGAYMLWDESEDDLIVRRGQLKVLNNSDVVNFLVNTNGNVTLGGDLSVGDDIKLTSDSSIITFGTNDEITLTHVHDTGLTLTNTISGTDNRPVVFKLKSEEDTIVADDVIGALEFASGDSDGTDAATNCAGIYAVAENTFSTNANSTKLVFTTGESEDASIITNASATAKMTLSSNGHLRAPGIVVYSKSVNRSLSAIILSTSFQEIHSDLRMKYVATQTIISCHLILYRVRSNAKVIYYQVYDWYNGTNYDNNNYAFHYDNGASQIPIHIIHTLTGLTVGQTYYITFRIKASGTAYIYRSNTSGIPHIYLVEHVEGALNSGFGHTENITDTESGGGGA